MHLSPLHIDDWPIAGLGGAIVASLAVFIPSLGGNMRSRPEVVERGGVIAFPQMFAFGQKLTPRWPDQHVC
jgi:hypothetical protein